MGFKYFKGKSWIDISREERLYCAHLYFQIKGKELEFVKWLNENQGMDLPTDCEWEVGYEVCFYRDFLHYFRHDWERENPGSSPKRTFDLCLFSDSEIVIIEAKVYEQFAGNQLKDIEDDFKMIPKLLNQSIKVQTLLLGRSEYIYSPRSLGKFKDIKIFNNKISWLDLYHLYSDKIFLQADQIKNSVVVNDI